MTQESLEKDLTDASKSLLKMAGDLCWNNISDNCFFIISEIKNNDEGKNFDERRKISNKENDKKTPLSLIDLIPKLTELYQNFYDINLHVYKSFQKFTIIDIRYYSKNSLDTDYRKIVGNNQPMLHCKIETPAYAYDDKLKFNINWEHKPLIHKWKMFWWGKKMEKKFKRKLR